MPAVHFHIGKMAPVPIPAQMWRFPFMLEPIHRWFRLFPRSHIKHAQFIPRELVARQRIRPLVQHRPATARRRGLDQIDVFDIARLNPPGHQCTGIRRPFQHPVAIPLAPILGQLRFRSIGQQAHKDVLPADKGVPLAVGRVRPLLCLGWLRAARASALLRNRGRLARFRRRRALSVPVRPRRIIHFDLWRKGAALDTLARSRIFGPATFSQKRKRLKVCSATRADRRAFPLYSNRSANSCRQLQREWLCPRREFRSP